MIARPTGSNVRFYIIVRDSHNQMVFAFVVVFPWSKQSDNLMLVFYAAMETKAKDI